MEPVAANEAPAESAEGAVPADTAAETATTTAPVEASAPAESTETQAAEEFGIADITAPEGITVSEQDFSALKSAIEGAGLPFTKDLAQKLVDLESQRIDGWQSAQKEALTNQVKEWEAAAKADKEFGGDQFEQNLIAAEEAMKALATPELVSMLNESGLGSHPEMVRLFVKLAPLVREGGAPNMGQRSQAPEKSLADRLYGG
jgi:hypothetical protein